MSSLFINKIDKEFIISGFILSLFIEKSGNSANLISVNRNKY